MTVLGTTERSSLVSNLVVIVGAVLLVNGLIFGLGWGGADQAQASVLDPPGWVVGVVWTVLFALLAVARWRLGGPEARVDRAWVTALVVFCLIYPLYSLAPNSMLGGFLGNLATIAFALFVVGRLWATCRPAAACVLPVVPWVAFATLTIMVDWGWFGRPA